MRRFVLGVFFLLVGGFGFADSGKGNVISESAQSVPD